MWTANARLRDKASARAQRITKGVGRGTSGKPKGTRQRKVGIGRRRGRAAGKSTKSGETSSSPTGGIQVFRNEVRKRIDAGLLSHIQGLSRPDTATEMEEPVVYLDGDPEAARPCARRCRQGARGNEGEEAPGVCRAGLRRAASLRLSRPVVAGPRDGVGTRPSRLVEEDAGGEQRHRRRLPAPGRELTPRAHSRNRGDRFREARLVGPCRRIGRATGRSQQARFDVPVCDSGRPLPGRQQPLRVRPRAAQARVQAQAPAPGNRPGESAGEPEAPGEDSHPEDPRPSVCRGGRNPGSGAGEPAPGARSGVGRREHGAGGGKPSPPS